MLDRNAQKVSRRHKSLSISFHIYKIYFNSIHKYICRWKKNREVREVREIQPPISTKSRSVSSLDKKDTLLFHPCTDLHTHTNTHAHRLLKFTFTITIAILIINNVSSILLCWPFWLLFQFDISFRLMIVIQCYYYYYRRFCQHNYQYSSTICLTMVLFKRHFHSWCFFFMNFRICSIHLFYSNVIEELNWSKSTKLFCSSYLKFK